MFDTVSGLPVHALVVHAVLVLLPMAALGTAAIAVVPAWRLRFGPLVLAVATIGLLLVPVATRSGARLQERLDAGGVVKDQIEEHAELGALTIWPALALWVLTALLVVMARRRRGGHGRDGHGRDGRGSRGVTVVAVLAVLAAVVAGGFVARVGHLGSTAVWSCAIGSDACSDE